VSYNFNFDLSHLPKSFFEELARVSNERQWHKRIGKKARELAIKFNLYEHTGLPVSNGLMVIEDLLDVYIRNLTIKKKFSKTRRRALLLPHCSRKHMDHKCKAKFNTGISSYHCMHCTPGCLVNKATKLGEGKGYDVYILPGGSCLKKILSKRKYEGIVGIACCEEIKLANDLLAETKLPLIGLPLIKNGCANTRFDIEMLEKNL